MLLRWLLECCLEIKIDTFILKDKELLKNSAYTKGKIVDLYVQTNAELINVEINNHPHGYNNERNLAYLANLYSRSVDISEDYNKVRKCIQLNLTSGKKGIDLRSKYALLKRNVLEEEVFSENFKIYEINVDLLKEAYYNKVVEIVNKDKPVIMLTLDREELKEQTQKLEKQSQELSNIKCDTARKMKNENIDIETISKVTGLSIKEIQALQK